MEEPCYEDAEQSEFEEETMKKPPSKYVQRYHPKN